ncbi:hypothetical protein Ahu01nite_005920 [Winogradskya humida]|uniref:Uncharacterized protein n=1 Tax=Winogradskya humida TaxID=113566 RepID=A0ABQ3ZFY4_9ACTN|nr:hypothetical protein Ahu01nite_005920 [Actinoplanes humidus]
MRHHVGRPNRPTPPGPCSSTSTSLSATRTPNLDWEISYEAELDNFPLTSPAFPYDLDTLVPTKDPPAWLHAPAAAIQRLTNWHPAQITLLRGPRPLQAGAGNRM